MYQAPAHSTRMLLISGFGGLLALMAIAGLDAMRILRTIQNRNEGIRAEFLARNRLLNQIRSDLYVSGTFVRDYLLEPESEKAEAHRTSLQTAQRDMDLALKHYGANVTQTDRTPFLNLEHELTRYWQVLQPVLLWGAAERRVHGYAFLRDEVYPRRTAMLGLADQIGAVNERQLNMGNIQVSSLFSQFRLRLGMTLLATLLPGALLAGYSMRRILLLEREAEARFLEAAHARMELKELSVRLVEVQENERRVISRELHDEVGQSLAALVLGLGNLAAALPTAASSAIAQLSELKLLAATSVGVVRDITLLLRPSMLDDLGLVPALQWQAREVSKRSGIDVTVVEENVSDELPDEHKTAIFRVVQETLHNCEKHSGAKHARVTVRQQRDALLLSVQDDGRGFTPQTNTGLGLRGMRERIENLGGILNVESETDHGSLITVRLPFPT